MATRQTRLILKNSLVPSQTLPSSGVLLGEALVNLGDGIVFFTGGTSGSPTWVDSGNGTPGYFEVGSNLHQLKIRDKITSYSGVTNLTGKFLSGTTNGFVLADISDMNGISGFTYDPNSNTFTITDSSGDQYPATIQAVTGLTVNGNLNVTGTETVNNLTITGTGQYNTTASGTNPYEIINYGTLTAFTQGDDVYVTGNTYNGSTDSSNSTTYNLLYHGTPLNGPFTLSGEDTYTTGGTYDNNTKLITFDRNDTTSFTVDLTNIDTNDTYVTGGTNTAATTSSPNGTINLLYNQDIAPGTYTLPYTNIFTTGFTYNPSTNTFTISDNNGNTYSDSINTVSGLTLSNLTQSRVVYVGANGLLTDKAGFTFTQATDTLGVTNIAAAGDVVVQGNLTVFGSSVSAFTSNLYVEDNNVTLNYNPTGSTTITSVGAGWTIQDGSGIANTATTLNVGISYGNGNFNPITEYTSTTGNENRNLFTQLNDIIIRNTNYDPSQPDGKRVLAEDDILSGGVY